MAGNAQALLQWVHQYDARLADALNRLERFIDHLALHIPAVAGVRQELLEHYTPSFGVKVSADELKVVEQKFGLQLPPSYVHFVDTYGLMQTHQSIMLAPKDIADLHAVITDPQGMALDLRVALAAEDEDCEDAEPILKRYLCFARSEAWFTHFFFDYHSCTDTGETLVQGFDPDDWEWLLEPNDEPPPDIAMRQFISGEIDAAIFALVERFGLP